ncbi:MAG TPA: short chain dehydrogenase [Thermoanaerobaculia bacterium]|nr:short chain dehydrogenase [Thermoanaerobaculia bacterium]
MKILVVGATGTIGRAVVAALEERHEIVPVSHRSGALTVDIQDSASIARLYEKIGRVDAVVAAAGATRFRPLSELSEEDFRASLMNKLLGQINLVRLGIRWVADRGSFTLTSGTLARRPSPGGAAVAVANAGIEAFVASASLELPRGIRINAVSPGWIAETLKARGHPSAAGTPAATVARAFVEAIEGDENGTVIEP